MEKRTNHLKLPKSVKGNERMKSARDPENTSSEIYESVVTYEGPTGFSSEERVLNGSILKDIK